MLSAIFNIALGSLSSYSSYSRYSSTRHRSGHNASLLGPIPRFLNYIIMRPRYLSRYLSKSRQRVKSDKPTKLRTLDKMFWNNDKPTALSILLSPELQSEQYGHPLPHNLLLLIASSLHYTDIVNLSLASKGLRQVIFPSPDLAARSEALRIHSCENGSKSQCWICSSQICQVRRYALTPRIETNELTHRPQSCSKKRGLRHTEASLHLQTCKPSCSNCYRRDVCRPARYRHSKSCKLARGSKEKDVCHYGSSTRDICQSCVKLSPRAQQTRREARDRTELDRLARLPLACSQCKMPLPNQGPRWWVCSTCFAECQHRVHPAWAEKMEV